MGSTAIKKDQNNVRTDDIEEEVEQVVISETIYFYENLEEETVQDDKVFKKNYEEKVLDPDGIYADDPKVSV